MNTCVIDGCDRPVRVKKRGLCRNHYHQWGLKNRPRVGLKPCSIEACTKDVYARGFCHGHYERNRTTGSPERAPKPDCECGAPSLATGKCKACYMREWQNKRHHARPVDQSHPLYKEEVGYQGAHLRIRNARGLPSEYKCILCGVDATEWALSADAEDLRYGPCATGRKPMTAFSLRINDYLPMCRNCHRAYDADTGNRNYKTGEFARFKIGGAV